MQATLPAATSMNGKGRSRQTDGWMRWMVLSVTQVLIVDVD
jgi:hypothetical protein